MKQKVISLDIETMAVVAEGTHPSDSLNKFGLSYVAPITEIALYTPELGALVLNATDEMVSTTFNRRQLNTETPIVKFLRELLSQPDMTLIGHNVVFDLRQLGGHYQFEVHPTSKVFDVMTLAVRMMIAEPDKQSELSLLKMVTRFGLMEVDSPEFILYTFMKPLRERINQLDLVLADKKEDDPIWAWAGGYIPPTRPKLLTKLADRMVDEYVALDAYYPYHMFLLMNDLVDKIAVEKRVTVPDTNLVFMKWPELPDLMEEWQKYLVSTTNQSIRGVDVDTEELERRFKEYTEYVAENMDKVAYAPDPNEKYPKFDSVIMTLMYYELVLSSLKNDTPYTNVNQTWKHWEYTEINPLVMSEIIKFEDEDLDLLIPWAEFIKQEGRELTDDEKLTVELVDSMDGDREKLREALVKAWSTMLRDLDYSQKMTKVSLKKLFPANVPVPTIDLLEWVRLNCYDQHERDEQYSTFLAKLKLNWMRSFVKMSDDNTANNIISKNTWKPYYMYCICDTPLPSHDEFVYHPELTTDKFKKHLKALKDQKITQIDYAAEVVKTGLISVNKKAMAYFLGKDDENDEEQEFRVKIEQLEDFRLLQQNIIMARTAEGLLDHSQLDGKIHSVIINIARTGRDTSTLPNMQNPSMKKWAGVFVAPIGFTLMELDYANAENKSGAMISKDNAFAMSTESGDFHTNQAMMYWAAIWESLDYMQRLQKRDEGKAVTFGVAYGMGIGRLAITLQITYNEAKELIEGRKRAYPMVAEADDRIQKNCAKRWQKGLTTPAWVSIWDKSRIQVPIYFSSYKKRKEIAGNKTWNYMQQSSVGAMVHRSIVLIDKHLREMKYKTYIALNVHDSVILAVNDWEYANTNVVQEILQIMCNIVPQDLCQRTMPPVHFVSEIGPENSRKWGKRMGQDYPYPMNEFINQWGRHSLPEDMLKEPESEWEAPTWVGPVHEGWTLEGEMKELREKLGIVEQINDAGGVVINTPTIDYWKSLNTLLITSMNKENRYAIEDLTAPKELSFNKNGEIIKTDLMTFPNFMLSLEKLFHAGVSDRLVDELILIQDALETIEKPEAKEWSDTNEHLFKLIPESEEPISA